jgi:hypothetical protein
MAYASYVRRGDRFPPAMRMLPYSLEAAYDLIYTLRDLRRTLVLVRSGLLTFFPEETDGLQHIYGIIEREISSWQNPLVKNCPDSFRQH